jgi:hypothetical protein
MSIRVSAVPAFLFDGRLDAGLDFAAYESRMREYAALPFRVNMPVEEREHLENAGINLQRVSRISRTYKPSEAMRDLMGRLERPQIWMLLSEVWCGDSAQCVPIIVRIAELSPRVSLRILLRDEHPDIMDAYLTNGKRCIPKLIAFAPEGNELGRWGPRSASAQAVVDQALAEGLPKPARMERLHLWYGRNRGVELEGELAALLSATLKHGID